jgi:hypothetical protein
VRRAIYRAGSNRVNRPEARVSVIGCYAMNRGLVFVEPKGTASPRDATDQSILTQKASAATNSSGIKQATILSIP